MSRVYESNGPDVKIRGSASHVAEKYIQLARDAQSSGDPVAAENFYQHAEHYFRLIAAAQEQYRQTQPFYRQDQDTHDESYDESEEDGMPAMGGEPGYAPREPRSYPPREAQPYHPREPQPYLPRDQQPPRDQQSQYPQQSGQSHPESANEVERLPSFITGGGQASQQGNGQNGHEGGHQSDRYPLHRRRRRHRGPRNDAPSAASGEEDSAPTPGE